MKRFTIAAAVVVGSLSLPVLAQSAPPPPPKGGSAPTAAPPPPSKAAPPPAAAGAPPPPSTGSAPPPPSAGMMDPSKMGPMARKPTNEAQAKKEIEAFIKAEDALLAAKNWDGLLARIDFPIFMVTDTLAGVPSTQSSTREAYLAEMKPFWEQMPPTSSTRHKLTVSVLSDSLANVVDDYEMTMGKTKMKGRNASLLVKVNGQWKYKTMTEAGWGDMSGSGSAAAPAAAPATGGTGAPPPPPPGAAGNPGKGSPPPPPAAGTPAKASPPPPPSGGSAAPPPPPKR